MPPDWLALLVHGLREIEVRGWIDAAVFVDRTTRVDFRAFRVQHDELDPSIVDVDRAAGEGVADAAIADRDLEIRRLAQVVVVRRLIEISEAGSERLQVLQRIFALGVLDADSKLVGLQKALRQSEALPIMFDDRKERVGAQKAMR